MKLVIIGGTGLIGSQVVTKLTNRHEVIAASPKNGINTLTTEGLDKALQNACVVVDVSNSPSFAEADVMNFFRTSTENLIAAGKRVGVQHLVILSVVGTNQLQASGYFRAKQVQEDLVKASGIPYTIVQATQFFEFAGGIAYMSTVNGKVLLPSAYAQPIARADVASFIADIAIAEPVNTTVEIGGPERLEIDRWVRQYIKSTGKQLEVVTDEQALYSGAAITPTTLVPQQSVFTGTIRYKDWISKPGNLV